MQGKRIYLNDKGTLWPIANGEYGKYGGEWYAKTPNGLLGGLANHEVEEHEDGTISVSPSILVNDGTSSWHGYLKCGVWSEC